MTKFKKILIGGLVGVLSVGGLAAFKGAEHEGRHAAMREVLAAAELSADQQADLKALRDTLRDQRKDRRGDHADGLDEVLLALDDGADAQALHDMLDQRVDERRAVMHENLDQLLAFWGELEPQQQTQALEKARALRAAHAKGEPPAGD